MNIPETPRITHRMIDSTPVLMAYLDRARMLASKFPRETGEPVVGTSRSTLVHVKHDGFTVLPHESGLRDFNSALDDVYSSVTQQIRGFGVNEWDTGSVREVEYMW